MIFDYDPRLNREGTDTRSSSRRLLEDILTEQIVTTMASGTASNYLTQAYGSNHRILMEGVARLLSSILVDSVDNIDDMELSQLRAEFLSTRLLYVLFLDESTAPQTTQTGELLELLLSVYAGLLEGATKTSIDQTLNGITNSNVTSEVNGYIAQIRTSILATTEFNTDGVIPEHKHYAFAPATGLGSTLKPLDYRWGDDLHTHEIIDGVVQPHTNSEGVSHTHEVYFGLPQDILRLQHNLRQVFEVIKPAHIKTGSVSSILQEVDRIAPNETDSIDGLDSISLGLGSLYQEDMRKARVGVWEDTFYGYVNGNEVRLFRTNLNTTDELIARWVEDGVYYTQRLRVISVNESLPPDVSQAGESFTFIRSVGETTFSSDFTLTNGILSVEPTQTYVGDGEPLLLSTDSKVYFPTLLGGTTRLAAQVVRVDSKVAQQGIVLFTRQSSPWRVSEDFTREPLTFVNETAGDIQLPSYFTDLIRKSYRLLPIVGSDLNVEVTRAGTPLNIGDIFYDADQGTLSSDGVAFQVGDVVSLTYPVTKSEIKVLSELNDTQFTLNASRPTRSVSLSGRGEPNNNLAVLTNPMSYVLNTATPVSPYSTEEKRSTYSVSSSDIIHTKNQVLNSGFTLNNASLGQDIDPSNVSGPAVAIVSTSYSLILYTELGFFPSYISSIVDDQGNSYTFSIQEQGVLVKDLSGHTTLTITALSTTPLTYEGSWFKGETLAEGQAFLQYTDVDVLPNISESTPEELIENPLGLDVNGEDADRRIYAKRQLSSTGVRGELSFFEDSFSSLSISGSNLGFLHDLNKPQEDTLLYQDPTLYLLGPLSALETTTFNTIPTHLFFNYTFLNDLGGDGYYFSIYRVGVDGVKYYQTLTPVANGDGFTALQEIVPPNGAPIAYKLQDEGGGGGFAYNYSNGDFSNNYEAEVTASFNHIPYQTYYIEVTMEEDGGGADSWYFFSSGTNAPYVLNTSWDTSAETYRLDEEFGGDGNLLYAVTFATNPGEVVTFEQITDPNPTAIKDEEDVGAVVTIQVGAYIPSEPLYGVKALNFAPDALPFIAPWEAQLEDSNAPITDEHSYSSNRTYTDEVPLVGSVSDASLLLLPSNISEPAATVEDDLEYSLRMSAQIDDIIPLIGSSSQALWSSYSESQTGLISDQVSIAQSLSVGDTLPLTQEEQVLASANTFNDLVPVVIALETHTYEYTPQNFEDLIPTIKEELSVGSYLNDSIQTDMLSQTTDTHTAYISTYRVSSTIEPVVDTHTTTLDIISTQESSSALVIDDASFTMSLASEDLVDNLSDDHSTSLLLAPSSATEFLAQVTDESTYNLTLTPSDDVLNMTDEVAYTYSYDPINLEDTLPLILDAHLAGDVVAESVQEDTLNVIDDEVTTSMVFLSQGEFNVPSPTDETTTSLTLVMEDSLPTQTDTSTETEVLIDPYIYIGVRYNSNSVNDEELFSIYEGQLNTLNYPAITTLMPDSQGAVPVEVITGDSNDLSVHPTLTAGYNNPNNDAFFKIGPLVWDRDYQLYASTESDDTSPPDMELAFKIGGSNESPYQYLKGESYVELFPGPADTLPLYHLHTITPESLTKSVKFAFNGEQHFDFNKTETVRLYAYIKYTYTDAGDDADLMRLRPAPDNSSVLSPNGTDGSTDFTGWLEPDLHDANYTYVYVDGGYVQFPGGTKLNPDNEAQASWLLQLGTRHQLQLEVQGDATDVEVYFEVRADDGGSSATTVYNASSVLPYMELIQNTDGNKFQWNYFFTMRRDGFIIWETDGGAA
jgi:hypothetical protein